MGTKVDFTAVCRICLKSKTLLNNLFETDAPHMLTYCGFLEVEEYDKFPNTICKPCNINLTNSYKLKQLCISSQLYWKSLLEAGDLSDGDPVDCILDIEPDNVEIKLQSAKIDTAEHIEVVYKSSECGESTTPEGHCCNNVNENEEQNTRIITDNCDTKSDMDIEEKSIDEPCIDFNEVPEVKDILEYECPQCKMKFEHDQDVSIHQSIHRGDQTCNFCQKTFETLKILKRHLKTHMLTKSHVCKLCNKGFPESSALVKHQRHHHLGIPREKTYECLNCGQRFFDKYYLKVHQRKHTGEKPLECNICDKAFYDPRSLKVHLDAHKGLKPYLCSYCGKSFVQNAHLRQHIAVHNSEKPYMCTVCNKHLASSTSLRRHKKVHLATYKCSICSEGFSKKQELYRHEGEKHDIKRIKKEKKDK